jgi:hypothetical protein
MNKQGKENTRLHRASKVKINLIILDVFAG